jgi:peroxiredoxin/uncharacterized membrane protein YphA (DoxX/SURF4 family)
LNFNKLLFPLVPSLRTLPIYFVSRLKSNQFAMTTVNILLLGARLLLAAVFLTASVSKLKGLKKFQESLANFKTPTSLLPSLTLGVPGIELLIGIALLFTHTAWTAALAAFILLLVFITVIVVNLAKGNAPDCNCFGETHSRPISKKTIARNASFAAVAAFIIGWGSPLAGISLFGWLPVLTGLQGLAAAAIILCVTGLVFVSWLLLQVIAQQGRILLTLDTIDSKNTLVAPPEIPQIGLPVGSQSPRFTLKNLSEKSIASETLFAEGKPVLLAFTDPNCGPCNTVMPFLSQQQQLSSMVSIFVVSRGSVERNREKSAEFQIKNILLQKNNEVAALFQVSSTPSALLIMNDRTIGSPVAIGPQAIQQLVGQITSQLTGQKPSPRASLREPKLKKGEPFPTLELTNLDGKSIDLKKIIHRDALILFWNPGCGYCKRMLDDIRTLDENIIILSTGPAEMNRAMELPFPVLLQQDFSASAGLGITGTPSGLRVSAAGLIDSDVAVGQPAIFKLMQEKTIVS